MKQSLWVAALAVALAVTAPVWAQAPEGSKSPDVVGQPPPDALGQSPPGATQADRGAPSSDANKPQNQAPQIVGCGWDPADEDAGRRGLAIALTV
jgi:hypothetical protein